MQKVIVRPAAPRPVGAFNSLRIRMVSGCALLALLGTIGLFASRPAHTAGGPVPVAVTNTVQNRDVDNATHEPFQSRNTVSFNGPFIHEPLVQVPKGKRLVIVSMTAEYNNAPVNSYSIFLEGDHGQGLVGLSLTPSTDPYPLKTQPVRMTAEAGDNLTIYIDSNQIQNNATLIVSTSGYFVDVP